MVFRSPDWWGKTTANRSLTRLSCRKAGEIWFDVMMSYGDLGTFLSGFSLISLVQVQVGDLDPSSPGFDVHILDPFFTDSLDEVFSKITSTSKLFIIFVINIVFAPLSVAKSSSKVISASSFWPVLLSLSIFFFFFVFLHFLQLMVPGCWALAWISYIIFVSGVSFVRYKTRSYLNIPGEIRH